MSRIASVFSQPGHKALIPYLTVGYPDIDTTLEIARVAASSGGDILELGIPFSDPMADGTTIQRASHESLKRGTTPELCLETAARLRKDIDIPLVFMTYYNPVHRYGLADFCRDCAQSGIDGLIVPDLPPEEGEELDRKSTRPNLSHFPLSR